MRIIPHEEWTLRGHWWSWLLRAISTPVGAAIWHHSVTAISGMSAAAAFADVRTVEEVIYNRRQTSGFSTIAYSYLIHPNGMIFEGRGVKYRNGANTSTKGTGLGNSNTISICFIGNYHPAANGFDRLTPEAREAAHWLLWELEMQGHLSNAANIEGHSHVSYTACCGDTLYAELPAFREEQRNYNPVPSGGDMDLLIPHDQGSAEYLAALENGGGIECMLTSGPIAFSTKSAHVWSRMPGVTVVASRHLATVIRDGMPAPVEVTTEVVEVTQQTVEVTDAEEIDYTKLAVAVADEQARRMQS